jgi:hypothetical protein
MKYAIQRQYLLPVYQHMVVEADSVEQACQIATGGTRDWDSSEQDYDSCRETTIEAYARSRTAMKTPRLTLAGSSTRSRKKLTPPCRGSSAKTRRRPRST